MSVYVRLKRENRTIFLTVEPSDTFREIKTKVGSVCAGCAARGFCAAARLQPCG